MRESAYSEHEIEPQFWFNLKTLKVEVGPQSNSKNRVGPFASEAEAANALSLLRKRSESWREEDEDQKD